MPALSFSVFRDKIESGAKRQTIRGNRKRPIKVGHKLFLYWKQQCASECEKLGEALCIKVLKVEIEPRFVQVDGQVIRGMDKLDKFAIADGFDNWLYMMEWFANNYGLPFRGVLIEWDSIKSPF